MVYFGLGSNSGDREAYIAQAVHMLATFEGIRITACSSLYETEPVGGPPQDFFLNAAVAADVKLDADELLAGCQRIERGLGRVRNVRWGPRTIDIDILLIDDRIIETEDLIIPHPRLHRRGFVLAPLAEIAADVVHPVFGVTIGELSKDIGMDGIRDTGLRIPL